MGFEITPLSMGSLEVSGAVLQSCRRFFDTLTSACIAWLITGGEKVVLVDTGPAPPEWGEKYHRKMQRGPEQYLVPALAARGLNPQDVDLIINTHLHWDHVYGNTEIPHAPIWVQRSEVRYAAAPLPRDARAYETDLGAPLFTKFYQRLVIIDGDREILPGLRVIHTPGHTPGSQAVLVETEGGVHAIAGDTINLYDSLNFDPAWPPGIFQDLEAVYASVARLRAQADVILPGHDPLVLEKRFPERGNPFNRSGIQRHSVSTATLQQTTNR